MAVARTRKRVAVVGSTAEYEETCHLGEGGFGAVVKARHRLTGETVAIKRLTAPGVRRRELLWEACNLQDCSGIPFVVGLHGLVRDLATADVCLAMECVGPSLHAVLRDHLSRGGPPLSESTVRTVMWQLLTGAKKMHERHIIHRDIKTENILVGDDHTVVKICDLGLAMPIYERPPYKAAGTLWYMAPEMLLGMPDYDALVDSWSLGCVMAELITGRPLFQRCHELGQLLAIFNVLGVPDDKTWPWFSSTAFAAQVLPEVDVRQKHNCLRHQFPEAKLSKEGFDVLNGLLTCNPDKRLTAAAALKLPWFAKVDALSLPRKEEPAAALPKKKDLLIGHPAPPKKRKQCVIFF
ncbi:hypothetical protein ACP4OV_007643 [Aristida adscensionis]